MTLEKFGWHKDERDDRDLIFAAASAAHAIPPRVDLSTSPHQPPIEDQRPLASCSAHAIGAMFQFVNAKEGRQAIAPSRLFIYYNERKIENTISTDAGAKIRDGIKAIARFGVCDENDWPYVPANFADAPPDDPCYVRALGNRAVRYFRITGGLNDLKACLADGYPFVFGMSIYSNFVTPQVAATGVATLPAPTDTLLGGHAVTAVGYDDRLQTFLVRNSCGAAWGKSGYFTLPYAFLESRHLSDDFWTLRTVE